MPNKFLIIFSFCIIFFNQAKAFFESQIKYDFENKWLILLNDNSHRKKFKAMRSFLLYPKLGLPVLRNLIRNTEMDKTSWEIAALMGILGDSSDAKNLLKIWKKSEKKYRSEVFFGAVQRIYLKQRVSDIEIPKVTNLNVIFEKNKFSNTEEVKNAIINYQIANSSKSNIFLRVEISFWKTNSNENLSPEFIWLKPGEKNNYKTKTALIPKQKSKEIRLDFRIWEVGFRSKHLIHQTKKIPI